jgi:O-antigen/teichoic acid export membrane protein
MTTVAAPVRRPRRLRLPSGALARNTAWMLAGNGSRTLLQVGTFVLVTRILGSAGFGAFAGVLALVNLAVPFVSLGAGSIMIKNAARDPEAFLASWRATLRVTALTGAGLFLGTLALAPVLLPKSVPLLLVLAVAASDLLAAGFFHASWMAYQAFHRMRRVAQLQFLLAALKLGSAVALAVAFREPTAVAWGYLYAASTLVATAVAVRTAHREIASQARSGAAPPFDPVEGFYFSSSLAAQNVYNDLDKTMLARMATLEATGIYAAAYRIVEMAYLPVRSLFYAAYANFFKHGARGVRASLRFGRSLMPAGLGYAAAASAAILLAAPIIPFLSGAEYREAADAARWLALIPFLRAIHHFAADILSGAGRQGSRTLMQVVVAVANVLANLWLIPAYGWKGAAWASLLSDGLLAMLMWAMVYLAVRREAAA